MCWKIACSGVCFYHNFNKNRIHFMLFTFARQIFAHTKHLFKNELSSPMIKSERFMIDFVRQLKSSVHFQHVFILISILHVFYYTLPRISTHFNQFTNILHSCRCQLLNKNKKDLVFVINTKTMCVFFVI